MAAEEIRVLVVDDSAVIRSLVSDSIGATPGMKVVGAAGDGRQALEMLDSARPDVITLDIQMPNMDGLATLDAILARCSIPVIMVSSLTKLGAEITLDALDRGAVDYLAKPDYGAKTRAALQDELPRKIRIAAGCDVRRIVAIRRSQRQRIAERAAARATDPAGRKKAGAGCGLLVDRSDKLRPSPFPPEMAGKCVAIGISTGGATCRWPSCSRRFGHPWGLASFLGKRGTSECHPERSEGSPCYCGRRDSSLRSE